MVRRDEFVRIFGTVIDDELCLKVAYRGRSHENKLRLIALKSKSQMGK